MRPLILASSFLVLGFGAKVKANLPVKKTARDIYYQIKIQDIKK